MGMFRLFVVILLCLTFCSAEVKGQPGKDKYKMQSDMPYLEPYSMQLPSTNIYDIMEDDEGFVWVSTKNGVARYDGVGFALYGDEPGVREKQGNAYTHLMDNEDKTAILAICLSGKGFITIDKKDHHVAEHLYSMKDGSDLRIGASPSIVNYKDSLFLVYSNRSLRMIRKQDAVIVCSDSTYQGAVRLCPKEDGAFLVYKNDVFEVVYDGEKISYNRLPIDFKNRVINVYEMAGDDLYVEVMIDISHFDYYRVNLKTKEQSYEFTTSNVSKSIVNMGDGVWIGTYTGLNFYSYKTKQIRSYTAQNSRLSNPHITSLCKSKHQPVVWIGTEDGLVKNDYYSSKFLYIDLYQWTDEMDANARWVVKDSCGRYWLASGKKLYKQNQTDSKFEEVTLGGVLEGNNSAVNLVEGQGQNKMYIATSREIYEYDILTDQYRLLHKLGSRMSPSSFQMQGNSLVWSEGVNGICFFDLGRLRYKHVRYIREYDKKNPPISDIYADGDSLLWILNDGSRLSAYDLKKDEFREFPSFAEQAKKPLGFKDLRVLYRHGECELWVLSGYGLYYFLPNRGKLVKVEYSPFFSSSAQSIAIDSLDNVWIGSEYGIACINNTDGRVYEYSNQAYNIPRNIQNKASSISSDGHILMTGRSSFVEFSIDNFSSNDYFPMPKITQYQYRDAKSGDFDKLTQVWNDVIVDSVVTVPAGVRSVSLNVRVLNYSKSEYNTIQWRKEGETRWKENHTMIPLLLTNLDPGVTKLELRTVPIYTNEVVDMPVKRVYINKEVYLYEELWFKVLMWAFGIATIISIFFMRARMQMLQRLKLQAEVDRQTSELQLAYARLTDSQKKVEKQNLELTQLSANLENQVKERTAELEKEKARIEEGSKLKSVFLANLSHEVRTPMNCIVGFAKLLADPTTTKEESTEFVHLIKESANSLLALLGDLLDVSRIESGQMRVNFASFPVMKDLNDIYKMLLIEKKKAKVDFQLNVTASVSDVVLNSDRDRFKQIIINLVYNAFKFTEEGHVAINASVVESEDLRLYDYPNTFATPTAENLLLISIEDTGIGMPADKLDVIFEPFRKLNNNKTLYPGLGLGLNICKNLIQLLGGQIWVTSIENMGTTFFFFLPIPKVEDVG